LLSSNLLNFGFLFLGCAFGRMVWVGVLFMCLLMIFLSLISDYSVSSSFVCLCELWLKSCRSFCYFLCSCWKSTFLAIQEKLSYGFLLIVWTIVWFRGKEITVLFCWFALFLPSFCWFGESKYVVFENSLLSQLLLSTCLWIFPKDATFFDFNFLM